MAVRICDTGAGARLSQGEVALLADAVREYGRATLLVPSPGARDAARREIAGAGMPLGVEVLMPSGWIASLWQLFGDGRAIVGGLDRQLLMAGIAADVGEEGLGPLRGTPGTVRLLARMARDLQPAIAGASAETASDSERVVLSLVGRYGEKLAARGLVECSEAAETLAGAFAEGLPSCARAVFLRDVTSLPGYLVRLLAELSEAGETAFLLGAGQESFGPALAAAFGGLGCNVEREDLASAAPAPVPVPAEPGFLEVAGPHARASAYADEIVRLALRSGAGARVAVASPRPAELLDDLAPYLAARGVSAEAVSYRRFGETAAGCQLAALGDLVRRMRACAEEGASATEWWPAPELPDWLCSPLSGADAACARALDRRLRSNRCLGPEAVLRELQSVQGRVLAARAKLPADHLYREVPCVAADVVQLLWRGRPVSALKAMLSVAEAAPARAFGTRDGRLRRSIECAALRRAIEVVGERAHVLGVSQDAARTVLDGICARARVRCAPEGEAVAHARFLTAEEASLAPAGTIGALLFADVDVHGYPLAHGEGSLPSLALALGRPSVEIEPVARVRTLFSRALATAPAATLARVTHDRQAKDRYPAAIWTELRARAGAGARIASVGEGAIVRDLDPAAGEGMRLERTACLPPQQLGADAVSYLVPRRLGADGGLVPNQLSASQIESYAACPLCWFMGSRVRPQRLDAGFGNMEKGNFVHDVMERFHARLRDEGLRRVTPGNLRAALDLLRAVFAELRDEHARGKTSSSAPLVPLSAVERLQVDDILPQLEAAIRYEAAALAPFAPEYLEYSFNGLGVEYAGWPLGGRIDRVDVDAEGRAVVIDYKHRAAASPFKLKDPTVPDAKTGAVPADDPRWLPEHTQALIYAQALRRALGLDVRGALYFSTKTRSPALGGAVSAELAEEEPGDGRVPGLKSGFPAEEAGGTCTFEALLDRVEAGIADRLGELSAGAVSAAPDPTGRCGFNHPLGFERRGA